MPIGAITVNAVVNAKSVNLEVLASGMTILRKIERLKSGQSAGQGEIVRGSEDADAAGGLWRGTDYEAPAGVLLTYIATGEDGSDQTQAVGSTTTTENVDYGGDYLAPVGRPELGINVIIEYGGVDALYRSVSQEVLPVLNRPDPVVVQFGRHLWEGQITFLTMEDADRRSFLNLMQFPSLMFVADEGFGFDDPVFLSPGGVSEQRTVGLGSESSRRWGVDFVETARPPTTYAADLPEATWQERLDAALTWLDADNQFVSWYDFAGFRLT